MSGILFSLPLASVGYARLHAGIPQGSCSDSCSIPVECLRFLGIVQVLFIRRCPLLSAATVRNFNTPKPESREAQLRMRTWLSLQIQATKQVLLRNTAEVQEASSTAPVDNLLRETCQAHAMKVTFLSCWALLISPPYIYYICVYT